MQRKRTTLEKKTPSIWGPIFSSSSKSELNPVHGQYIGSGIVLLCDDRWKLSSPGKQTLSTFDDVGKSG